MKAMRNTGALAVLAVAIAMGPAALAQPPAWQPDPQLPAAETDLPSSILIGALDVVFETTTLDDVKAAFGGEVRHEGEAGSAQDWLCYTAAGGSTVWVMSNAEMGGPDGRVTAIAAADNVQDRNCRAAGFAGVSLFDIIGLGSTVATVTDTLGDPSGTDGGNLAYYTETPFGDDGTCTTSHYLTAVTSGDVVTGLWVGQITAC